MSGCSAGSFLSFHSDGSLQRQIVEKIYWLLHTAWNAQRVRMILLFSNNLRSYFLLFESRPRLVQETLPVLQSGQPHRCFSAHKNHQDTIRAGIPIRTGIGKYIFSGFLPLLLSG